MIPAPPPPTMHAECVTHLVYHSEESPVGAEQTYEEVDRYHRRKGWDGYAYHFRVTRAGLVQTGRSLTKQGAHTRGLNECSIGIALTGHGDLQPPSRAQFESAVDLGARLARIYDISIENVIGHREINHLVDDGRLDSQYRTIKSCPGTRVSMWKIRKEIALRLFPPPQPIELQVPDAA